MRQIILLAPVALLPACATPSDVKQAIKAQSDAYVQLDLALRDFGTGYSELVAIIGRADEETRARICAFAVIENKPTNELDCGTIKAEAGTAPNSKRAKELAGYRSFISKLDQAITVPTTPDPTAKQAMEASTTVSDALAAVRKQVQAVAIINSTVADYYNVDLSPGPEATKAAIENVKSLAK